MINNTVAGSDHATSNGAHEELKPVERQNRDAATQTAKDAATQTVNLETEESKDQKSDKKTDKESDSKKPAKDLELTGIGRSIERDGEKKVIDEAEWEVNPETDEKQKFAIVVSRTKTREMVTIWSKYLQQIFRKELQFTYGVSFDGESVSFAEPYAPLYFNFDTLKEIVEKDQSADAQPKDFEILTRFYNKWIKPEHDQVRAASQQSNVRFENLWAVFEPGKLLYTKDLFGQPQIHIIGASTFRGKAFDGTKFEETMINDESSESFMSILFAKPKNHGRFCVDVLGIEWDGSTRVFSRSKKTLVLDQFTGTRDITSFEFYPLEHYAQGSVKERDALLEQLQNRGYLWKELVSEAPRVWHHTGAAHKLDLVEDKATEPLSGKKPVNLDERVIVDHDGPLISSLDPKQKLESANEQFNRVFAVGDKTEKTVQYSMLGHANADFDNHPPEKEFSVLQARLCPSVVNCASLSDQTWFKVTMNNLVEVKWARESFESLVLEDEKKEMLKLLVEQHRKNRGRVMSDLIQGKGKGLVVVLHGPPGVGKTLTAESIAEYTQKPLFPINVSELTTEQSIVSSLQRAFEKASRWDAVLLLDEADVILEQRSLEDLKRNGIVSVFLRMLEYYQGILFLTTNRLNTIDSAFVSRIHVAVFFKELDSSKRRKIWQNFIQRLDDSETQGKEELYENINELAGWQLNGREIRNVLTIAQSLSLGSGRRRGALRFTHVEQVANQVLDFRDYTENTGRESKLKLKEITDRSWPGSTRPSSGYGVGPRR